MTIDNDFIYKFSLLKQTIHKLFLVKKL